MERKPDRWPNVINIIQAGYDLRNPREVVQKSHILRGRTFELLEAGDLLIMQKEGKHNQVITRENLPSFLDEGYSIYDPDLQ